MQYWYNVTTGQVESDDERSQGAEVMGPYPSREQAAQALATAKARTEKWDAEDREWEARGTSAHWGDDELED